MWTDLRFTYVSKLMFLEYFGAPVKWFLNYSRIALEFYRTALKNYSETVLDMLLNVNGTVVEPYIENYFVLQLF